jgi:hypothetical protein
VLSVILTIVATLALGAIALLILLLVTMRENLLEQQRELREYL